MIADIFVLHFSLQQRILRILITDSAVSGKNLDQLKILGFSQGQGPLSIFQVEYILTDNPDS